MKFEHTTLGEICSKIGSGATPKGGKNAYCDRGIAIVRSQNVLDFSFFDSGLAFINEGQAVKLKNVEVLDGDILLNITGDSVARCCGMDSDYLPARVNQHVCIIRGNADRVLNNYLLYFLQSQKGRLLQLSSAGATRNALTKGMIEQLEIDLPALSYQKRVVGLLDSLQNKIALNQKINENLEQQAQALFKFWFVDFEPFNMEIPMNWKWGNIADLATEIVCGKTPSTKKPENYGEDIPFITIPDMHNSIYTVKTERKLSEKGANSQAKKTIPANSVCVSCIGTAGLVSLCAEPSQTNQQINSVVPKDGISPYYIYFAMLAKAEEINKYGQSGSTIVNLNKSQFSKLSVLIPALDVLSDFHDIVHPLFEMILSNQEENLRLASLRDALLPQLMSGELDVSAVEV